MRVWKTVRFTLVALAVAAVGLWVFANWLGPVASSFYTAYKMPAEARLVPVEVPDASVSATPGMKLAYHDYSFEVPWTDLDEAQTKLAPNPLAVGVTVGFHSGLRILVVRFPEGGFRAEMEHSLHTSPERIDRLLGAGPSDSDYVLEKRLYEFTPVKMHYWALSPQVHYREGMLLTLKAVSMPKPMSAIYNIHSNGFQGFQYGDPMRRPRSIEIDLYSAGGNAQIVFDLTHYSQGVSQAEINRVVQTFTNSNPQAALPSVVSQSNP